MAKRQGFTLIELLVVVVIIGILASVALPSFVGAQDKARNSAVTSNAKTVKLALEQFATDNQGSYPAPPSWVVTNEGGGGGKRSKKKRGCGDDCLDGLEEYLPGHELPRSPWGTEGATVFARVPGDLADAKELVMGEEPLATEGTRIDEEGRVPSTMATSAKEYGAISYSYSPAATAYVLYGTGKKGKEAIVASSDSNQGK